MVPTRGFSSEYKEAARSFIPRTMHRGTGASLSLSLSARLHFETLSKLGNCIKSDLYLSVPGILAPREMQRHKRRATRRALSSITGVGIFNKRVLVTTEIYFKIFHY